MEVSSLQKYIQVSDDVFPETVLEIFTKICKESDKFEDASVIHDINGGSVIDKKTRKTQHWALKNIGPESLTEVHWTNLLHHMFHNGIKGYCKSIDTRHEFRVNDIQVLKYGVGGHYNFHIDHAHSIPRTFSCIYFVNDDYEGGDLAFRFPLDPKEYTVSKRKNRLIIWPSNFLYPHSVKPVTKGERYSVVSWAL